MCAAAGAVVSLAAWLGGARVCVAMRGGRIGRPGGGTCTGLLQAGVPAGSSGIGVRVQAGGALLTSKGVLTSGDSVSGRKSGIAGRVGDRGAVVVEAGGGLVVVCPVGLGVQVLLAQVEQEGCPGGVATGAACESAGRQSSPLPGRGKETVLAGGL